MKNPLSTFVIATSGNLGKVKQTDIQRWVEKAGGVSTPQIDKNTTHLVCSWEDYQAKVPKVKQALRNRKIHIVTYDWLEDALQKRRAGKERGRYLLANVEKQKRREEKAMTRSIKKVDKKIRKRLKKDDFSGEAFAYLEDWIDKRRRRSMDEYALEMGSGTHHIYKDETGFEYNICLARVVDIHTNKNDFFHLKIYESNALPHLYAALARYRRPGTSAVEILAPVASFFDEAFAKFRRQFERKTGVKWEDRLDAVAVKEGGGGGGGGGGIVEERYFYRPPPAAGRKGRGVLPEGKTVVLVEVETARAAIVAEENAQDTTASEQGDAEERNSETSDQSPDEDSQSAAAAAAADDDDDNSDSEEEDESEDTNPKARSPPATDSFYTWHENFVAY